MRRFFSILITLTVWGGIVAYVVFAVKRSGEVSRSMTVAKMVIRVYSPQSVPAVDIVRCNDVKRKLNAEGENPVNGLLAALRTERIEALVEALPFVCSANVFADGRGVVYVDVEQRLPQFRVKSNRGDDFYYTADEYIEPVTEHSAYPVIVVTGDIPLPFEKDYAGSLKECQNSTIGSGNFDILDKLHNFVNYIFKSDIWHNRFSQIVFERGQYGEEGYRVRLIPVTGRHTVLLGELDDYEKKLARLAVYYDRIAPKEGVDKFEELDVQYDGQIVGRNTINTVN